VAIDVYVAIDRRFGAQAIPVDEAFAAVDLRRTLDGLDTEENPEARAGMIDNALDLVESFAALGDEARAAGLPVQASGSPAASEKLTREGVCREVRLAGVTCLSIGQH
jgi:hypothetical protein